MTTSIKNGFHAFQLYRRLLRVNQRAYPISQLPETNQTVKSKIYQVAAQVAQQQAQLNQHLMDQIKTSIQERNLTQNKTQNEHWMSPEIAAILSDAQEQAENYIQRVSAMSSGQLIETHDPDYWEKFYASVWSDYQRQEKGTLLFRYLEERKDIMKEWYYGFEQVKEVILDHMSGPNDRVLFLGNGLSLFPIELYRAHQVTNVVSVDISPTVVTMMRQVADEINVPVSNYDPEDRMADLRGINFYQADVRRLDQIFPPKSFKLVVDKATCDSLWLEDAYDETQKEISMEENKLDKGEQNLADVQEQVHKVLADKGAWIIFSTFNDLVLNATSPEYHMDIQIGRYSDDDSVYVYLLTKKNLKTKKPKKVKKAN